MAFIDDPTCRYVVCPRQPFLAARALIRPPKTGTRAEIALISTRP
jgi:hypothetical protein